ncbi:hypothetical protein [Sphingopyxis bauzanensis]|uniref:hypothetical protein n=1 Tax=Sphingopyxis bauzanensis TaxID=651663 RepID=UPI00139024B8|nr:hypothetical protein [Sphingopyxis bauzanensis]
MASIFLIVIGSWYIYGIIINENQPSASESLSKPYSRFILRIFSDDSKSGTSMAQQFVTALRLPEAKQIMADMRLAFERRLRNIPLPSLIRDRHGAL